jgi:hypothetical protein
MVARSNSVGQLWTQMMARSGRRTRGDSADSGGTVGRAVVTPALGPDSALKAHEQRGAGTWQPRGDGALTGGPSAESGG